MNGAPGAGKRTRERVILAVAIVLVVGLVTGIVFLSISLSNCSRNTQDISREVIDLLREDPESTLHNLMRTDSEGSLLTSCFENLKAFDLERFDEDVKGIYGELMGKDEIGFFTSTNDYGDRNSRVLGYLAGCLQAAGVDEADLPYPEDDKGEPYEGEDEIPYDQERIKISGSAAK